MVLHSVAREYTGRTVIAVNRQRHRYRTLRVFQPPAIIFGDLKIIGDQIELLAGHVKSRMIVNLHARTIAESLPNTTEAELHAWHRGQNILKRPHGQSDGGG